MTAVGLCSEVTSDDGMIAPIQHDIPHQYRNSATLSGARCWFTATRCRSVYEEPTRSSGTKANIIENGSSEQKLYRWLVFCSGAVASCEATLSWVATFPFLREEFERKPLFPVISNNTMVYMFEGLHDDVHMIIFNWPITSDAQI